MARQAVGMGVTIRGNGATTAQPGEQDLNENIVLGLTYMYADLGSAPVDFTAIGGRLKGDYKRNYFHMVGFSLNWKTGGSS